MKKNFPQDLNDSNEYRPMVRWFSPLGLLKTLEKVIPSTLFEKYADGRLIHAALDAIAPDSIVEICCGGEKGICGKKRNDAIWVDYVADLGDGFDSTYAIAYMIGQKELHVGDRILPRADCLVMGGDEVYPDASRDDYHKRMQRPYRAAFPITTKAEGVHPPVYLIPGNHDWYDGLQLFSAIFCSGHDNKLGSWIAPQTRSYFAIHLGQNWWVWGFDSQLDEDVDGPQSDYFDAVAKAMMPNAKVILCASVPTWLKASLLPEDNAGRERFYRGVHFIASKLHDECQGVKIPLLISGDTHHYNRYEAEKIGTNFVTAGGGGAFLHPTHKVLEDSFEIKWVGGMPTKLKLGVDNINEEKVKSIYPSPATSRRLAFGNLLFWYNNWDFSLFLGFLYWICALSMLAWRGYGGNVSTGAMKARFWIQVNNLWPTPIFLLIFAAFLLILVVSADKKTKLIKWLVVPSHSLIHATLILFGTSLVSVICAEIVSIVLAALPSITVLKDILYFGLLFVGMLSIGFMGSAVWGMYLTLVSWVWGAEANNAFSALRLDSYKHFLRIKLDADTMTIFPIAVDRPPSRQEWTFNDNCEDGNQNTPVIVPKLNPDDLGQHLIESPIVISINNIAPLKGSN
jgi:hypothetical protein